MTEPTQAVNDLERTKLAERLACDSSLNVNLVYRWLCMARDDVALVRRAVEAEVATAGEGERIVLGVCLGVESGVRHGPVGPGV